MRIPFKFFICLSILLVVISACKNELSISTNDIPDIDVPENEINKRIKLAAPEALNNFRKGETVDLTIEVISDDQVAFTHDYGVRMFTFDNTQWVEIANLVNYPEGYLILSPAGNDPFKLGYITVYPILPELRKAVNVRIFLVGNIFRDGEITDEKTAAYIDVVLEP